MFYGSTQGKGNVCICTCVQTKKVIARGRSFSRKNTMAVHVCGQPLVYDRTIKKNIWLIFFCAR